MRWAGTITGLSLAALLSVGNLMVLGQLQPGARPKVDLRKGGIENPLKNVVQKRTVAVNARAAKVATPKVANPKVEPGKVRWHATFEQACASSKKSGRPVLLFQMMGNLDDQFC